MNYKKLISYGLPIKAWIKGVPIDQKSVKQLQNVATLPIVREHLAVMPDVHAGIGATIGSVIPTQEGIIPSAVGVDKGCGVLAVKTSLTRDQLPDLAELRKNIEEVIPTGNSSNNTVNKYVSNIWYYSFEDEYQWLKHNYPEIISNKIHPMNQIGTLGGGNHFIELCVDIEDSIWIMLHSGSRNIGNRIGNRFIKLAKEYIESKKIKLLDKNLAYLQEDTSLFFDYIIAVNWAQRYAYQNRKEMLRQILLVLDKYFKYDTCVPIDCHHNYVNKEQHYGKELWITRKGAVSAKEGQLGIIPGSMGTQSFIVKGKGNKESFNSCSHGAGRIMSRSEAKKNFSLEDHLNDTEGVECRKDKGVIDETPKAYKNIAAVMAAQSDLVEIVTILKQILCIKG